MLSTQPPSLAGGEAAASPCKVDKAWTVGGGTCEGSDTSVPERWHLFPREEGCWGRHREAAIVTPRPVVEASWWVFPEGKLAPTDPPPTAETCHQTIRLLDGQLTVYTDGLASVGTKNGGAGVIVTRGDPADPTILHQSHLRGAAFTSSFAEEAAAMQLALDWATTRTHSQSAPTGNRFSRQLKVGLQ